MEAPKAVVHKEFPIPVIAEEEECGHGDGDRHPPSFYGRCLTLPCFHRRTTPSFWERMGSSRYDGRWWSPGLSVIKKIREWSELIAGPKWKTFIRRIRRRRGAGHTHNPPGGGGKLNYDLVNYSLNFDEGPAHHGNVDDADDEFRRLRSFSVGYGRGGGGGGGVAAEGEKKGKEGVGGGVWARGGVTVA